ncbi:MAG: hypothetical protein KDC43_27895 [Saprospiraceae bacterium]|nr:hypothetical protein [Saprospiraceae bacterium]MCB0627641.1 hypothetical protein [Saprospiraceae bacterium]
MKSLAVFLALLFLVGSLFPRTDFSQLARIPVFLQHFSNHQQLARVEGTSESIVSFVVEHYVRGASHEHPGSGNPHQGLPLTTISYGLTVILPGFSLQLRPPQHSPGLVFPSAQTLKSSDELRSVFRPPVLS